MILSDKLCLIILRDTASERFQPGRGFGVRNESNVIASSRTLEC